MKHKHAIWLFALALGLASVSMDLNRVAQAQGPGELVMVVNKGNSTNLTKADAKKLLLGVTSTWANGAKVVVVLRPAGSAERAAVLKKACGMSESDYTRYQLQASFTGRTAASVHEAASATAVKAFVKANAGAVGFLQKSEAAGDDVKIAITLE